MSNVFISHSSQDKPFVRRLGIGLLSEGIPVWLDSWSLELGDSLLDKIYEGIDESSIVVLVMSRTAVESGWVNRELNAALAKEQQVGRKFLIPIKIDDSDSPLKIADRIHADFSKSFSEPLSRLVDAIVGKGVRNIKVAAERELLGLSFSREVHLDVVALRRSWNHLSRRHPNLVLKGSQVIVNDDPEYESLLQRLHASVDNIASHPNFSPRLERDLKETLERVKRLEEWLREGVATLLANGRIGAVYWFAKMLRGEMVYALWSRQMSRDPALGDYGRSWHNADLHSDSAAASFFETDRVDLVYICSKDDRTKDFHFWVGREECPDPPWYGYQRYLSVCRGFEADKYVFPQMMRHHLESPERTREPIWNLQEALIALA